ncbi:MAG: hypothetical protein RMK20_03025 [Verrucomicrobiales bacterium]|nr:hypothetical protein [Verrucomicrobiales bacterium]
MSKGTVLIVVGVLVLVAGALLVAASWAKRKTESVLCGNQMASIGCAARLWAQDHDGLFPSDLLSMSNEVITPELFVCPGDHARQPAARWAVFTPADSSYEIVAPGVKDGDTNGGFLRCKIHGHLGYADGTVFDGVRRRTQIP